MKNILKKVNDAYNEASAFLATLSMGLITGFIACLAFIHPEIQGNLSNLLKEYQTLFSAIIATFFAALTIRKMQADINIQKEKIAVEDDWNFKNKTLKNLVVRSQLTHVASDLYNDMCKNFEAIIQNSPITPNLSEPSIKIITQCIPYTNEETAQSLYKIVRFYQIYNSRLQTIMSSTPKNDKTLKIQDTVTLNHYALKLLNYARSEQGELELKDDEAISCDDMTKSLDQISNTIGDRIDVNIWLELRNLIDSQNYIAPAA